MQICESTVASAIRYCYRKYCRANIIIAGPIGSGKKELANAMKDWFDTISGEHVTVFSQEDYYKEKELIPEEKEYGRRIDSIKAFEKERFIMDVRNLFDKGCVLINRYNIKDWSKKWPYRYVDINGVQEGEPKCRIEAFQNNRTNIFIGLHAITFLKQIVPDSVTIYLNTDASTWMPRRIKEEMFLPFPKNRNAEQISEYYENFILPQIAEDVLPQLDMADIVVKY